MSELSSLFNQTQNELISTESLVQQYEYGNRTHEQQQLVTYQFNNIQRNITKLYTLVPYEAIPRQSMWTTRINNINEKYRLLQSTYGNVMQKQKRSVNEVRIDLLSHDMKHRNNNQSNLTGLDQLSRENNSLHRIHKQIDEQLDMSAYAYHSLANQRDLLKTTQRKALDVVNVLGLSSTILKLASRYDRMNGIIVYSCMGVTLLVLGVTYYYFRYLPKYT